MHELGIAQNILQIVQQSVPQNLAADVRGIRIRVGKLSGVVPDSLDFCFGVVISQTEMPQAKLDIEQVPIVSRCKDCGHRFEMEDYGFSCPACKSVNLDLISGRELEVVEIVLAEDESQEAL
jgi:hydrogenase nickel incorporation protein HypA/HybF